MSEVCIPVTNMVPLSSLSINHRIALAKTTHDKNIYDALKEHAGPLVMAAIFENPDPAFELSYAEVERALYFGSDILQHTAIDYIKKRLLGYAHTSKDDASSLNSIWRVAQLFYFLCTFYYEQPPLIESTVHSVDAVDIQEVETLIYLFLAKYRIDFGRVSGPWQYTSELKAPLHFSAHNFNYSHKRDCDIDGPSNLFIQKALRDLQLYRLLSPDNKKIIRDYFLNELFKSLYDSTESGEGVSLLNDFKMIVNSFKYHLDLLPQAPNHDKLHLLTRLHIETYGYRRLTDSEHLLYSKKFRPDWCPEECFQQYMRFLLDDTDCTDNLISLMRDPDKDILYYYAQPH